MNKQIILVDDDGVTCLLCKRHFIALAGHMQAKHGYPAHLTGIERLALYGLPEGARLAAKDYRKNLAEKADILQIERTGKSNRVPPVSGTTRRKFFDVPVSEARRKVARKLILQLNQQHAARRAVLNGA